MAAKPCPTCHFSVPEGAEKCPQCGRVFGEVNRCPHCHAIAAVRAAGSSYVCVACGKPRTLKPGTTLAATAPDADGRSRPRRLGLRALAGLFLATAVMGAALSTAILGTGFVGIATAVLVGSLGAFAGVRVLRHISGLDQQLDEHAAASRAEAAKQVLLERSSTVPELASRLGTSEQEADVIASRLAADDTSGVVADLDETEGVLRFGPRRAPIAPTRAADPDAQEASEADEEDAESEAQAARAKVASKTE